MLGFLLLVCSASNCHRQGRAVRAVCLTRVFWVHVEAVIRQLPKKEIVFSEQNKLKNENNFEFSSFLSYITLASV